MTEKSLPRNFSMVFAFAGDSTITRFFISVYILGAVNDSEKLELSGKNAFEGRENFTWAQN